MSDDLPLTLSKESKVLTPPFDINDPKNYGRPYYFDVDHHAISVIKMIQSDEIQIALQMLDNVPAWYRENYPPELAAIKQKIYQQTYDQIEYATDQDEYDFACNPKAAADQWNTTYCYPRNEIINAVVEGYNKQGMAPWVLDVGCSHGNMPMGLLSQGSRIHYKGLAPNYRASQKLRENIGDGFWREYPEVNQPTILVCTEVIEHCMNPHDVVHTAHKEGVLFDQIILSLPLGCLYGGLPDWSTRRLGHVRGWTELEFKEFAAKSFPGYSWTHTRHHSQVLHGVKL